MRGSSGHGSAAELRWLAVAAALSVVIGGSTTVAGRASALPVTSSAAATHVLSLPVGHSSTEASVAVNPRDPGEVLVVAKDQGSRAGAVGIRMWRSHDAGRTFRGAMFLDGRLDRLPADASNAVALFDGSGRPAPAFLALRYATSAWQTRIMLGKRVVASRQYGPPIPRLENCCFGRTWFDKPWAAFDPRSGRAYVTWTELGSTQTGPTERVAFATAPARGRFSKPHLLGAGSASQPVVGPGSTVLVVWYQLPNLSSVARILSSRSRDGGARWSTPRVVASGINARGYPPFPTAVRVASKFVACWQQYAGRRVRVACSRSPTGTSWSRPRVVAQPPGAGDAFEPALAAGPDGRLWLAFYRLTRRSTSVELWSSNLGGDRWQRHAVLMRRAVPGSSLDFLGDYQGLAATRSRVIAAFTMPVRAHAFRKVVEVARLRIPAPAPTR